MRDGWGVCDAAMTLHHAIARGSVPLTEVSAADYRLATLAAHLDAVEEAERRKNLAELEKALGSNTSRRHSNTSRRR